MIYFLKRKGENYKLSVFHRFNSFLKPESSLNRGNFSKTRKSSALKIHFVHSFLMVFFDLKTYLKPEKLLKFLKNA